ncbi:sporulation protein YabP [Neomoorella thermoacetica]|uniref:Spore protein YabP n=1 Tax=Moorella thermoacetica (strain ATCC 39073 / JCM 9320) TaxID=264732 RepID=Q2RMB2_MOOTA|nr:sporulation protein YabP [Moorella thermoacetica]AKX92917.1 spore protein YabP [Moorella thermoacetica]AKX95470.1 spore protein YabP [Moorella thermoacetica]OIQ52959.1 spore protein YabP [Moorella thermoacetica]OIQ56926.1 spore protein YabP [Moorella thermoacetica]OIQ62267.1 spore protein YabP [Moorella thermoacetica]
MADGQHQLSIINREKLVISGVLQVLNYDEEEILLETTLGYLVIKGSNFNISNLSLETGNLELSGRVNNLSYSEGKGARGKGLMQRLFK